MAAEVPARRFEDLANWVKSPILLLILVMCFPSKGSRFLKVLNLHRFHWGTDMTHFIFHFYEAFNHIRHTVRTCQMLRLWQVCRSQVASYLHHHQKQGHCNLMPEQPRSQVAKERRLPLKRQRIGAKQTGVGGAVIGAAHVTGLHVTGLTTPTSLRIGRKIHKTACGSMTPQRTRLLGDFFGFSKEIPILRCEATRPLQKKHKLLQNPMSFNAPIQSKVFFNQSSQYAIECASHFPSNKHSTAFVFFLKKALAPWDFFFAQSSDLGRIISAPQRTRRRAMIFLLAKLMVLPKAAKQVHFCALSLKLGLWQFLKAADSFTMFVRAAHSWALNSEVSPASCDLVKPGPRYHRPRSSPGSPPFRFACCLWDPFALTGGFKRLWVAKRPGERPLLFGLILGFTIKPTIFLDGLKPNR